ncbi:hypothetical protein MOO45_05920 [Bombilactobacillus folatiphilus]|uniref:Uncharacterized protein n=1 Tax=Bombilactobacillus folatiphilus TaxID=2923362 RepID=A0ABY4P7X0_9LACO|nr:hypothetical protein [Bombilactobacillus folatiphilus]UQS81737.1 hypothetical protein MOO45_05920 [Bombilactobacillus folatiphilus]
MSKIKLTFGTKSFLQTHWDQNSTLAYNVQHPTDYLLITETTAASNFDWSSIFPDQSLNLTPIFYLTYLELDADNRALLINKITQLPEHSILYRKKDQKQFLIITSDLHILHQVSSLLNISITQLNAALVKYAKTSTMKH